MLTLRKRSSIVPGFVLLLIVLAANAIVTIHELRVQVDDQAWVIHSQQVLLVSITRSKPSAFQADSFQRPFFL